jgi:hypothetical protein
MWDGTSWKQLANSPSPNLINPAAAFVPTADAVIALGFSPTSNTLEMWSWNGSWRQLHPTVLPTVRVSTAIGFDPVARRLILFGGYNSNVGTLADTWAWDGTTWSRLQPAHSPPPRGNAFLLGLNSFGLLLTGGSGGGLKSEVWGWDGSDWRQFQPQHALAPGGNVVSATETPDGPAVMYAISGSAGLQVWRWRNGDWNAS